MSKHVYKYSVSYFQLRLVIDKNLHVVSRWKKIETLYTCTKAQAIVYARVRSNCKAEKVTIKKLFRREAKNV